MGQNMGHESRVRTHGSSNLVIRDNRIPQDLERPYNRVRYVGIGDQHMYSTVSNAALMLLVLAS